MDSILNIGMLLVAVILAIWLFRSESGKKKDTWSGVLEIKEIKEYMYKGKKRTDYLLYFRKDTGEKVVYNATEEVYNSFEKGDLAEKQKNVYFPVKKGA